MNIQYMSDLRLDFSDNSRQIKHNELPITGDILVLAGDIFYLKNKMDQDALPKLFLAHRSDSASPFQSSSQLDRYASRASASLLKPCMTLCSSNPPVSGFIWPNYPAPEYRKGMCLYGLRPACSSLPLSALRQAGCPSLGGQSLWIQLQDLLRSIVLFEYFITFVVRVLCRSVVPAGGLKIAALFFNLRCFSSFGRLLNRGGTVIHNIF